MKELLCIPLLFTLATDLFEDVWQEKHAVPLFRRRTDLYQAWLGKLQKRWADRVDIKCPMTLSQKEQFWPFLEEVCWKIWEKHPDTNHVDGLEIAQILEMRRTPAALRTRDLLEDLRESGALTRGREAFLSTPYSFLHRTLLEYLASRFLARRWEAQVDTEATQIDIAQCLRDSRRSVVMWMLMGSLAEPLSFLHVIIKWAQSSPISQIGTQTGFAIGQAAELVADCMLECKVSLGNREILIEAWNTMVRGLDEYQLDSPDELGQWASRVDWTYMEKLLSASMMGHNDLSAMEGLRKLLAELRSAQINVGKGNKLQTGIIPDVIPRIRNAMRARCPVARWSSVWLLCAFHRLARTEISGALMTELGSLLADDSNANVRAVAARALPTLGYPDSYRRLCLALDRPCRTTAASAALALAKLEENPLGVIRDRATKVLSESERDPADPLPGALIQALVDLIDRDPGSRDWKASRDNQVTALFEKALTDLSMAARGKAAIGLAQMERIDKWESIEGFLSPITDRTLESGRMRESASRACMTLARSIPLIKLPAAASTFSRLLLDSDEAIQVRRNAAIGLRNVLKRGYRDSAAEIMSTLIEGATDPNPIVAQEALMTVVELEEPFDQVTQLLSQYESARRILSELPMRVSPYRLELLHWLIDGSDRPSIVCRALTSLNSGVLFLRQNPEQYSKVYDSLLFRLEDRCLLLIEYSRWPNVLGSALRAAFLLSCLPVFNGLKRSSIHRRLRNRARELVKHRAPGLQRAACHLLGDIGETPDIPLLESLKGHGSVVRLDEVAAASIMRLQKRFLRR